MARGLLRSAAFAAAAALAAADAPASFAVAPSFTYVSGTDAPAGGDVSSTQWFDVSSAPLVLRLTLDARESAKTLTTPSAGFIKLSSRQASASLSSAVIVSAPAVESVGTGSRVNYTVTFNSRAYGAYNVSFDCDALQNSEGTKGAACSPKYYTVQVGFTPALSIQQGGLAVTNTWLDYTQNYSLLVGVGSAASAFDTSMIAAGLPSAASTEGIIMPGLDVLAAADGSATVTALKLPLLLDDVPGIRTITTASGAFLRSDGVRSVAASVPLRVGWKPLVAFNDTSMAGAVDTSAFPIGAGPVFWFNQARSSVKLIVSANDGQNFSASALSYGFSSGQLLAGSSALPGAAARTGGITSSGSPVATAYSWTYSLVINGIKPGVFSFNIPAGAIMSLQGIGNAAATGKLSVGYEPRLRITQGDAVVTDSWLDPAVTYNATVLPTAGTAFASPAPLPAGGDVFSSVSGAFTFTSSTNTTSAVSYALSILAGTAAAKLNASIAQGQFPRSDGVSNTFVDVDIRVGFQPQLQFNNSAGTVDGWFSAPSGNATLTVGAPSAAYALAASVPAYSTASTGLFAGAASLPGGIASGTPASSGGFYTYPLNLVGVPAGQYVFNIAAGTVCLTNGACNAPATKTLNVGFDVHFEVFQDTDGVVLPKLSWFDAQSAFTVKAYAGLGKSWAPTTPALTLSNGSTDIVFASTAGSVDGVDVLVGTPSAAITSYGRLALLMAQGTAARSDGVRNAASTLTLLCGFKPTPTVIYNSESNPWLIAGTTAQVSVALPTGVQIDAATATSSITFSTLGGEATLSKQTTTGTVSTLVYDVPVPASFKAGTYPFRFAPGAFVSTASVGSVSVAGAVQVGFTPALSLSDINGNDLTSSFVDARQQLYLRVGFSPAVMAVDTLVGLISGNAANSSVNAAGYPQFAPAGVVSTTGLTVLDINPSFPGQGVSVAVGSSHVYVYNVSVTNGATSAVASLAGGAVCSYVGEFGGACNAAVNRTFKLGSLTTGVVKYYTSGNDYAGTVDADGQSADSKPMLGAYAGTTANLKVVFTGTFDAAATCTSVASALVLPDGFSVSLSSPAPACTATTVTVPIKVSSTVKPGSYDVTLPAGTIASAAGSSTYNIAATVRVVLGLDVRFLSIADTTFATQLRREKTTGAFFTSANDAYLMIAGAQSANSFKLTELITAVYDSTGKDVKSAVTGMQNSAESTITTGAIGIVYRVGLSGIGDGVYTFVLGANSSVTDAYGNALTSDQYQVVVIDRTAPKALAAVSTAVVSAGLPVPATALPALFSEPASFTAYTPSGNVVIPNEMRCILPWTFAPNRRLASAKTRELAGLPSYKCADLQIATGGQVVPGPAGASSFDVYGFDQAGNGVTASVSYTVQQRVMGSVTVVDARNVQSRSALSVKPSANGQLSLSVIVEFDTPVKGVAASHLKCQMLTGASACPSSTVVTVSPAASVLSRRFVYTVTFPAAVVALVKDLPLAGFRLGFVDGWDSSVQSAAGVPTSVASTVAVTVDSLPPQGPYMYGVPVSAVVGANFFFAPPVGVFRDGSTPAGQIKVVSAQPSTTMGLSVTTDAQGKWFVSGVPAAVGSAVFDVSAEDAAGNVVTAKSAVVVNIVAAPAVRASITLAASTLSFSEDGSDVSLDAKAAFAWPTPNVSAIEVQLRFPEGAGEVLTAVGLDSTIFDVTTSAAVKDTWAGAYVLNITRVGGGYFSDAEVTTALKAVAYSNTRSSVTSGVRSIRVGIIDSRGSYVASAVRLVNVLASNNAPVVAGLSATTGWDESSVKPVPVFFTNATITDADDTELTGVAISIAATASVGSYAGCNVGKDVLSLAPLYLSRPGAQVQGIWSSSACTLTLTPAAPLSAAPIAVFLEALQFVQFASDAYDPANGVTDSADYRAKRLITVVVTDNGAAGRTASTASSAPYSTAWQLQLVDHDPKIDAAVAYAAGKGFLASKDPYAVVSTELVGSQLLRLYHFPVRVPTAASSTGTAISFDLRKVSNGVFAGGAISDPDTYEPLAAASVGIKVENRDASAWVDYTALQTTYPDYFAATPTFTYSSTAQSVLTLYPLVGAASRTFKFKFVWGAASLTFYVDSRVAGCTLSGATNVATDDLAYPDNSLCAFPATTVDATSTTPVNVDRGGFAAKAAELEAASADLAALGVPAAQMYQALAPLRAAARGRMLVNVDPSALASSGSISLGVNVVPAATAALVQSVPLPAGKSADLSLAIKLTPAGTVFSAPVTVCVMVGDTADGYTRSLGITSQVDAADESKGYSELSLMADQTFDRATGQLCGKTTHFSAIVPLSAPVPVPATVPKNKPFGGSCPSNCHGNGVCYSEGKCTCNSGWSGYDCSLRACPQGESWGEAGFAAHQQSECSGRGVCDRVLGVCSCFDQYEGSACERMACPNGCSGKGKCVAMSEMGVVAASGYASWEAQRVLKCVCDAGYTGADCSLRTCPKGDDPETVCANSDRQQQRVTVGFSTLPMGYTPASAVDSSTDEMSLSFISADKAEFATPAVAGFFAGSAATKLKQALTTLPQFAVTGVDVAFSRAANDLSVSYDLTFTGATNTGNEALLQCPLNADGTMGCDSAACRPKFKQLRMFSKTDTRAAVVSDGAILQQPAAVAPGNTASTPSVWGVETTLILRKYTATGRITMQWSDTAIYGTPASSANTAETPLPPAAARASVAGPHGLLVDLADDTTLGSLAWPSAPVFSQLAVEFKWRLPECSVTQVRAAGKDLEKAECSNRGVCDRSTGLCECFNGYTGSACSAQVVYV